MRTSLATVDLSARSFAESRRYQNGHIWLEDVCAYGLIAEVPIACVPITEISERPHCSLVATGQTSN